MSDRNNETEIAVIWELIEDPHGLDLLCQAIQLILRNEQAQQEETSIDKKPQSELNEGTPVGSIHSISPNT